MQQRILFAVTEDWYFLSHRLPMARAARDAGFEVHVATRLNEGEDAIRAEGFIPHHLPLKRGSFSPIDLVKSAFGLRALLRELQPAILHNVAMKPILVGGLAALMSGQERVVNGLTGRGAVFTDKDRRVQFTKPLIAGMLGWLLCRDRSWTVVQNPDDAKLVEDLGVAKDRIVLIPGSGVETETLVPLPVPPEPVTAAYVGRMLAIKGVPTLIEAYATLGDPEPSFRLLLAGRCDPENPGSLAPEQLTEFASAFCIDWLGHVDDVREVWKQAHFAVLASSGGEGLPKSLLEAAACGRPMVATDVPGSREIAIDGKTAIVVPPDDPPALAAALDRMAKDADLRERLGANARNLVEEKFSADAIGQEIVALYRDILDGENANKRTAS
ncbi:N,N'-diacetylbacillosaminyl-diphospho-undecaprenol alpha-1,3-N-acetylgalactosaminyltransferase [Methyloligella halotolerans]|uniref:N, N'-diacetylbacillosaminyl-diphospho-undecaprenol alpha-1,3-N-acetylgalactosaminyltransferase n=1 Tax=Methyloligella halotolerans TaxID=1177755 RepID=A0A1E2RYJ5_9HYPH|nr:glycosyltransferase family 4 protein [Methyloligella halotolerans]ODA67178.1 N,N'-diacetylbacillosaminyl-diphospho-undecaprenol alpha-1,3-N-acetylgalactosaminyltransferase [Methyloligella halotolerans]